MGSIHELFPKDTYINQTEAARLAGVKLQSINNMIRKGRFDVYMVGSVKFILRSDVLKYKENREVKWNREVARGKSVVRYVLHPGYVIGENDGDRHFIGGPKLARLYGVDIRQCVFGDTADYQERDDDVHLVPRIDGNYVLPSNAKIELRDSVGSNG